MKVLGLSVHIYVLLGALKDQVSHTFLNFWLSMKDPKEWQIVPTFPHRQCCLSQVEADPFGQGLA